MMRGSSAIRIVPAVFGWLAVFAGDAVAGSERDAFSAAIVGRLGIDEEALLHTIAPVTYERKAIWPVFWRRSHDATVFTGAVAREGRQGRAKIERLPSPREVDGRIETMVDRVAVVTARRGDRLVVLYSYRTLGSDAGVGHAGYAYRFDGRAWRVDTSLTGKLVGTTTLDEARSRAYEN